MEVLVEPLPPALNTFSALAALEVLRVLKRGAAHERFRLSIGIAVEGVAGNLVVKALQLAHVLGHAERVRITGAIGGLYPQSQGRTAYR